MILPVAEVLGEERFVKLRALLDDLQFEDGSATAGWHARLVKNNEQAKNGQAALLEARRLITEALQHHPVFQAAVLPYRISPPLISRYGSGMAYGLHIDDAIMPGVPPLRSDISFTLFLSDPATYTGGALVTRQPAGEQSFKPTAGSLILYPSNTLHRVDAVTAGTRFAAVGWIQSLVRDPAKREILFDLDSARRNSFAAEGKTELFDVLTKSYSNLLRMWSEL